MTFGGDRAKRRQGLLSQGVGDSIPGLDCMRKPVSKSLLAVFPVVLMWKRLSDQNVYQILIGWHFGPDFV